MDSKAIKIEGPEKKILGWQCSNDGKFFVGSDKKKCRHCTPVYNQRTWDKLEKR